MLYAIYQSVEYNAELVFVKSYKRKPCMKQNMVVITTDLDGLYVTQEV